MKALNQQVKEASLIVLTIGLACVVASLSGCGKIGPQGVSGARGNSGAVGPSGPTGPQGYGSGLQTTQLNVGNSNCPNGGVELTNFEDLNNTDLLTVNDPIISITYVCDGSQGIQGQQGVAGQNGTNTTFSIVADSGANCVNGGYDLTLTDATQTQTTYICNGSNANGNADTEGTNGTNGGTVTLNLVQAIEPCGAASSDWKEVLLGLQGGQILSDFSETVSGQDTRLSFIPNGSYVDTDESGCLFTVSGDGSTWSSITWNAGSNSYSTWANGGFNWTAGTGWVSI